MIDEKATLLIFDELAAVLERYADDLHGECIAAIGICAGSLIGQMPPTNQPAGMLVLMADLARTLSDVNDGE